jgi:ubiquinone/menaquinone biosynthesis C-methylase UbiE
MDLLAPVRDRVLAGAALKDGETLLDVGCGDGLIAFGALQAHAGVNLVFSDISASLLEHARQLAADAQLLHRCEFIKAPAENLSPLRDSSVDAVTTRSVLIYVDRKEAAFREFHRVLKPGGRLSMFEPINIFGYEQPETSYWGLDVTPVVDAAHKLKAQTRSLQPPESDPMLNFDERDLLRMVQDAGFTEVEMDYEARITRWPETEWSALINQAPNPKLPTWAEAMDQVLTPAEKEAFIAHVRPQVEQRQAIEKLAHVFLRGTKT